MSELREEISEIKSLLEEKAEAKVGTPFVGISTGVLTKNATPNAGPKEGVFVSSGFLVPTEAADEAFHNIGDGVYEQGGLPVVIAGPAAEERADNIATAAVANLPPLPEQIQNDQNEEGALTL